MRPNATFKRLYQPGVVGCTLTISSSQSSAEVAGDSYVYTSACVCFPLARPLLTFAIPVQLFKAVVQVALYNHYFYRFYLFMVIIVQNSSSLQ